MAAVDWSKVGPEHLLERGDAPLYDAVRADQPHPAQTMTLPPQALAGRNGGGS